MEYVQTQLKLKLAAEDGQLRATYSEVSAARESYLSRNAVLEELEPIRTSRELAVPEAHIRDDYDGLDTRPYGGFSLQNLDDGCSVSDQDRASLDSLVGELANALSARSRKWQERLKVSGLGESSSGHSRGLVAEAQALEAALQGTSAHLAMFNRMREAVEQGIMQKQDEIDKDAFLSLVSNTKAHILKLQSLECHFLNATYKPDDLAALGKIHRELSSRLEQMRVELADAQKRLSVYRGLGPGFKDQVAAFRRLHQQLLDAQYMLESFKALNSDLQHGATDMQVDGDDGDFMTGAF